MGLFCEEAEWLHVLAAREDADLELPAARVPDELDQALGYSLVPIERQPRGRGPPPDFRLGDDVGGVTMAVTVAATTVPA